MTRIGIALGAVLLLWGTAHGQMGPGMHMRGMGPAGMAQTVGPDLMLGCMADLDALGLPPETRKSLEEKRFEIQKMVVRAAADLHILRLELGRMLDQKGFDLTAAQKKVGEISVKEAEIRTTHVEMLHSLAKALTEEQWQKLQERKDPCDHCGLMGGMPGGMPCMMSGGHPGGETPRHHGRRPDSSKEAEEFFKK